GVPGNGRGNDCSSNSRSWRSSSDSWLTSTAAPRMARRPRELSGSGTAHAGAAARSSASTHRRMGVPRLSRAVASHNFSRRVLWVRLMGEPVFRARGCFVCGTDTPAGLNCAPAREGRKVVVRFTPGEAHRGFSKAVHGGITASLLDEVVGVATGERAGGKCATVELAVTYRRPLLVGVEVRVEGWYVRR